MIANIKYIFITFLVSSATSAPPRRNIRAASEYRLPQDIAIPEHYDLIITIDNSSYENKEFAGISDITLKVLKETSEIKLHCHWTIRMTAVSVFISEETYDTVVLNQADFVGDKDTEILTIETATPLTANTTYYLHFEYIAKFFHEMKGFFLITYQTDEGIDKSIAATNFKPAYARRAFPCFDEPIFKATFHIHIRHLPNHNAFGNTEGRDAPDSDNKALKKTSFKLTSLMSTYLIAFVVSDFNCDTAPKARMPYIVCSRQSVAHTRRFALEVGPKIMRVLENYINVSTVDTQMTKLCQVSIPDFPPYPAENWGLAFYNELNFLYDEDESPNEDQQKVGLIIVHQLSHRWFGNLVTCHWWSDLFLNEGLAIYSTYFLALQVLSEWELNKQFLVNRKLPMLNKDSTQDTIPLSSKISTPHEIENSETMITRYKGSAMIHMMSNMMDSNTFQHGIQKYINDNQYGTVTPEDLWSAFDNSIPMPEGETLGSVMENWVKKPGYPVVSVSLNGGHIIFSQERFLTDGSEAKKNEKWFIPLTWATSRNLNGFNNTLPKEWLTPKENLVMKNFLGKNDDYWIVVNVQLTGYYRVKYDEDLQGRIDKALFKNDFDGISEINRAQMVDDYFNLVLSGVRTFAQFFKFLKFLMMEDSYYTWCTSFKMFHAIAIRISKKEISQTFEQYILRSMDVLYNSVKGGSRSEDHMYTLKRSLALEWACRLGHKDCIRIAKESYKKFIDKDKKPDRNMKYIVYCNGLRYSDHIEEDSHKLWKEYLESESLKEKSIILSALICVTDMRIFNGFLNKAINAKSGVRPQDAIKIFGVLSTLNPRHIKQVDTAVRFLITNYKTINALYQDDYHTLTTMFMNLVDRFTTQKQIRIFQDFLAENKNDFPEHFVSAAKAGIEKAKKNLRLTELFENALTTYFNLKKDTDEDDNSGDINSALHLEISLTALVTILIIHFARLLI